MPVNVVQIDAYVLYIHVYIYVYSSCVVVYLCLAQCHFIYANKADNCKPRVCRGLIHTTMRDSLKLTTAPARTWLVFIPVGVAPIRFRTCAVGTGCLVRAVHRWGAAAPCHADLYMAKAADCAQPAAALRSHRDPGGLSLKESELAFPNSPRLKVTRSIVKVVRLPGNLTACSAAILRRCLSNFGAILKF